MDVGFCSAASVGMDALMRSVAKLRLRLLIWLLVVVGVVAALVFTPAGAWTKAGVASLSRGFGNLPGIAWARESVGSAATSEEAPAPAADSERINTILEAGHALQEQGAHEEALRRYREALVEDEEYAPTHVALAGVYLQLGREDDAVRHLERAAELAPDSNFVHRQLGQLYLKRDDFEAGVASLMRAKEAGPQDQETRRWLGAAYLFRSYADAENAVKELEMAAELDPEDAALQSRLAMAYVRRDEALDKKRAITALERAVQLDPSETEAYYYLGRLYLDTDQREAGIEAWRYYAATSDDLETVEKVRNWLRAQEEGRAPRLD